LFKKNKSNGVYDSEHGFTWVDEGISFVIYFSLFSMRLLRSHIKDRHWASVWFCKLLFFVSYDEIKNSFTKEKTKLLNLKEVMIGFTSLTGCLNMLLSHCFFKKKNMSFWRKKVKLYFYQSFELSLNKSSHPSNIQLIFQSCHNF